MRNLTGFRERVTEYRRQVGRTEEELARELFISKGELNKRLHEYQHPSSGRIWRLSSAQVLRIVEVLTQWGAIIARRQAIDLLEMMAYPHLDSIDWDTGPFRKFDTPALPLQNRSSREERTERLTRLRVMLIDHSGFLQSHLESFVGRQTELVEIRDQISTMLITGGYITITGQAGQGKSSIIAKLIEEYGAERTVYHFIPLNPGPDYQVSLLRHLLAKLILKHSLYDWHVTSESRPVLRDYFSQALIELAEKGKQEVIFIDGLDQLMEDLYGERDLSFLPSNPPKGIVFVLGSRPNETLHPLKLHKPYLKYDLPKLSRQDFDRILEHRVVKLDPLLVDQLYQAMQGNALYLDLAAKEIIQEETSHPEEIIKRVADNPESIFSLSISRLQRNPNEKEWYEVLKPILALLLVAREPLSKTCMGHILDIDDYRLGRGLERLGGLIIENGQQCYTLFHLKLYNYLRQVKSNPDEKDYVFTTEEEEDWHKTLADWCEEGTASTIWDDAKRKPVEQGRRAYARMHYITHLYHAGERQWKRLFAVLDERTYGRLKGHYDPSMRLYAQDLDLGRQAAAWDRWTLEEGLELLPNLWRHTLLRCSLSQLADRYPQGTFQLLLLLKQELKALGLAELLTDPVRKARVYLDIGMHLSINPGQQLQSIHMLETGCEVARGIQEDRERACILGELGTALAQVGEQERAKSLWTEAK